MEINVLDGDSAREAIDARDRYLALREAEGDLARRYDGAMLYESRPSGEYLLRRKRGSKAKRSLGPRSAETDRLLAEFNEAKARLEARTAGLRRDLEARAPILVARGLSRVPLIVARVLRQLDRAGWFGTRLHLVGTNSLFAYEAMAGVRIGAGALATGDVDVLFDARRRVTLNGAEVAAQGIVAMLRKVDRSFAPVQPKGFRAVNDGGFMVDLIEPIRGNRVTRQPGRLSDAPDDRHAVAIEGLEWLVDAPKVEAVAFDERGLPVWLATIDPRIFAAHKLWVAARPDRDPLRRARDRAQAATAARIALQHLGLPFDDGKLSAVPRELLAAAGQAAQDRGDFPPAAGDW